jgi:hypothetical protein
LLDENASCLRDRRGGLLHRRRQLRRQHEPEQLGLKIIRHPRNVPGAAPRVERAFDPLERAEYARDAHPKRLTCATRPRAQNAAWCVELRTELTVELTVREPIRGLRRASMACESCANR